MRPIFTPALDFEIAELLPARARTKLAASWMSVIRETPKSTAAGGSDSRW